MSGVVKYIKHSDIDRKRWDESIAAAPNGAIYAYSFWLDAMATGWDALVYGEYEVVMPLPWRQKWGIKYLFQPLLTAQLGMIGKLLDIELFNNFLRAIPQKFRYLDMPLNRDNLFIESCYPLYQRSNFILPLHDPYENLQKRYRQNVRRNCIKAKLANCQVRKEIELAVILKIAIAHGFDKSGYSSFVPLYQLLQKKDMVKSYGVYSHDGKLLSGAVFAFSHQRAYYLVVGNHPDGRTVGASHFLIDSFIKDHAEGNLTLDFEGSDIPTLAHYYKGFGGQEEIYAALRISRLPKILRLLKH